MKPKHPTRPLILLLPALCLPLPAAEIVADFNDLNLGSLRASEGQLGGTGTGFTGTHWDGNTGVVGIVSGDLAAPASTHYLASQAAAAQSFRDLTGQYIRSQTRPTLSLNAAGTVWFSFLVQNTDAADRTGINFVNSNIVSPLPTSRTIALLGDALQVTNNAGTLSTFAVSAPLGQTALVVGRIRGQAGTTTGFDAVDIWINPDLSNGLTSMGAPSAQIADIDYWGASIAAPRLGILSYEGADNVNNSTFGGTLDAVRVSDEGDGFFHVTGRVPDPVLSLKANSPAANLDFGILTSPSGGSTASRTIRYENSGTGSDVVIQSIAFPAGQNGGGVFSITSAPSLPLTLLPGQSFDVTVEASPTVSGTLVQGMLSIDTDQDDTLNSQDKVLPVSVRYYTSGTNILNNGSLDADTSGWAINGGGVLVQPGMGGSPRMVRIKGMGDPALNEPDGFGQSVLPGANDWEASFLFTPVAKSDFDLYTGFEADGTLGDRSFQVVLNADSGPALAIDSNGIWNDAAAAHAMINLAYFPDGANGGPEGFYLFSGPLNQWTHLPGLGTVTGSTDVFGPVAITTDSEPDGMDDAWETLHFSGLSETASGDFDSDGLTNGQEHAINSNPAQADTDADGTDDGTEWTGGSNPRAVSSTPTTPLPYRPGDGILDATQGDTVNAYLVRIKGTGFGTPAATYSVSVSQPNSLTTAASVSGLGIFHAQDITAHTVRSLLFTTGDKTSQSGGDVLAATTPFWIDEVRYMAGAAAGRRLEFAAGPLYFNIHNSTSLNKVLTLRNTGFDSALSVTAAQFSNPLFSRTSPALPLNIPAGGAVDVTISFDASSLAQGSFSEGTLEFVSDDSYQPSQSRTLLAAATTDAVLLPNWSFEQPGHDTVNDSDTFASWTEGFAPAAIMDVPGIVAGSSTAAYLRGPVNPSDMQNSFGVETANFALDFRFAIRNAAPADRQLSVQVLGTGGIDGLVNLRYQNGNLEAYDGAVFQPILSVPLLGSDDQGDFDLTGDNAHVYRMVINGTGFGTSAASYKVSLYDTNGTSLLGTSAVVSHFQDQRVLTGMKAGIVRFASRFGNCPGFWVDDVSASLVSVSPTVTVLSFTKVPGSATINWSSPTPVTVQRSTDLTNWSDVSTGNATGTFTDANAPSDSAFYRLVTP
jgi:hypothetical protein